MENIVNTFDIETLDLVPTGVVLSLGICTFNISRCDSFEQLAKQSTNIVFDQTAQTAAGRTVSEDTLTWWKDQGEAARSILEPQKQLVTSPLDLFVGMNRHYAKVGFQPDRKKTRWFSRGYFDIAFMDDFCRTFELGKFINFWTWRDVRSYLDGAGLGSNNEKMGKPEEMIPHNSAHDAAFDAYMMQRMYQQQGANIKIA